MMIGTLPDIDQQIPPPQRHRSDRLKAEVLGVSNPDLQPSDPASLARLTSVSHRQLR